MVSGITGVTNFDGWPWWSIPVYYVGVVVLVGYVVPTLIRKRKARRARR